jgi:O-acetyl-ADP-ribose deacetylase (regulator of RNase III)
VLADYDAITALFSRVKMDFSGEKIGYPRIGAGLARGDWKKISKIIDHQLAGENHTLVEYLSLQK